MFSRLLLMRWDDFLANVTPDMDGKQVTEQGKKIFAYLSTST